MIIDFLVDFKYVYSYFRLNFHFHFIINQSNRVVIGPKTNLIDYDVFESDKKGC